MRSRFGSSVTLLRASVGVSRVGVLGFWGWLSEDSSWFVGAQIPTTLSATVTGVKMFVTVPLGSCF